MACANCETFDASCGNCRAYGHLPCKGVCPQEGCKMHLYTYRNMDVDGAVRVFDEMISEVVVIEAHNAMEANELAKQIGIRFVGHARDPESEYRYVGAGMSVGMNNYSSLFCINGIHFGDPFNWGFEPTHGFDTCTVSSLDEIDFPYVFHAYDGTRTRKGVAKLTKFEYEKYYCTHPTEFAEYCEDDVQYWE